MRNLVLKGGGGLGFEIQTDYILTFILLKTNAINKKQRIKGEKKNNR